MTMDDAPDSPPEPDQDEDGVELVELNEDEWQGPLTVDEEFEDVSTDAD